MANTYEELLTDKTFDEIELEINTRAEEAGLPVEAWESSSVPVVVIEAVSLVLEDVYKGRSEITKAGHVDTAEGSWLTVLAYAVYQTARIPAEFAQISITISDTSGSGPFALSVSQLWIANSSGLRYNNTTGGTLDKNGDIVLTFKAETSGAQYNSIDSGTEWTLLTPIAGVSVTDGGTITVQGRNAETDVSLRQRCKNKWPTLGLGLNADAWAYWAREASADITRVKVITNPDGIPGLTRLVVAGEDGAFTDDSVITAADALLQEIKTNCTTLEVVSAVNKVILLTGTVNVSSAFYDSVQAAVPLVMNAYQVILDIGETIYLSPIIALIQVLNGMRNVVLTNASSITLAENEVPQFDLSQLVYTQV